MDYVLFGSGEYGKRALNFFGKDSVKYFVDNDLSKRGLFVDGVIVRFFGDVEAELFEEKIVVTVSPEKRDSIENQLKNCGITNYVYFNDIKSDLTKERIKSRPDYIGLYFKAIQWIADHSIENEGIIVSTNKLKSYPEVTGYFVPSLLRWGYVDLATKYAKWLCRIQKSDGSWFDSEDEDAYIFDSAQILKGLLSIRNLLPEVSDAIIKGCDWILSRMDEAGRLITPAKSAWGNNTDMCDEIIHLYCVSPLYDAGRVYGRSDYIAGADLIKKYYLDSWREKIMNFSLLSHFYAYVMEALVDVGEETLAREAMDKMASFQTENGAVPAYNNCHWICSTGLFQLSLVWFRLGEVERGRRAFLYACKLQNPSGGWFGSYLSENYPEEENDYFPDAEISWANKYFLDSLYYKTQCEFEINSESFLDSIDKDDGRYLLIRDEVVNSTEVGSCILDMGCGKGRYLKNLLEDAPDRLFFAADISQSVMKYIDDERIMCKQGMLTCIPWRDDSFDLVYCCESLEHAIDIQSSIRELIRVTKPGGKIVIVDKPIEKTGAMDIGEWEQWIDTDSIMGLLSEHCERTRVIENIRYHGANIDGLFCAWIGKLK